MDCMSHILPAAVAFNPTTASSPVHHHWSEEGGHESTDHFPQGYTSGYSHATHRDTFLWQSEKLSSWPWILSESNADIWSSPDYHGEDTGVFLYAWCSGEDQTDERKHQVDTHSAWPCQTHDIGLPTQWSQKKSKPPKEKVWGNNSICSQNLHQCSD